MPRSSDPDKAKRQDANLLSGLSPDAEVRERQMANLTSGRTTHGATSGKQLEALAEQHEAELAVDYPLMDRRRRALLADRLARVELASTWTREHGIAPSAGGKRKGETWPIVDRLERWASRAEDMLAAAEQQQREASQAGGGDTLTSIAAELTAGDEQPADAELANGSDTATGRPASAAADAESPS